MKGVALSKDLLYLSRAEAIEPQVNPLEVL